MSRNWRVEPNAWEPDDDDDEESDDLETDEDEDDPDASLSRCPYCRALAYEDAVRCPACGAYRSDEDAPTVTRPIWVTVAAILCLLVALWWAFGSL